jgi:sucrose-6-phosphate hydrolase SacC (GH32 family)
MKSDRVFVLILITILFFNTCSTDKKNNDKGMTNTQSEEEKYRPSFHFTPQKNWMNDPNGMFFLNGQFHLYFQYHPESSVWGPMHWGHATSKDLIRWEEHPIALFPDDLGTIFSGSAVVDHLNTTGFGSLENPPIVAMYTNHDAKAEQKGSELFQTQSIAYSLDQGFTWTKFENNPVIQNPGIRDFRDPKVFWMESDKKWIMTLAAGQETQFYASTNLKEWTFLSAFGKGIGNHDGVWECPDLFPLKVKGDRYNKMGSFGKHQSWRAQWRKCNTIFCW